MWRFSKYTIRNSMIKAIKHFVLPIDAVKHNEFFSEDYDVFSFGKPPYAIEIMTAVKGLDFNTTFLTATVEQINDTPIRIIHLQHLIAAKKQRVEAKI